MKRDVCKYFSYRDGEDTFLTDTRLGRIAVIET